MSLENSFHFALERRLNHGRVLAVDRHPQSLAQERVVVAFRKLRLQAQDAVATGDFRQLDERDRGQSRVDRLAEERLAHHGQDLDDLPEWKRDLVGR